MTDHRDELPDFIGADLDRNDHGPDGMTPLQRLWAEHYVGHWKKKQAALDAGYAESDAANAGTRNCRNPNVMRYVSRLIQGRSARITIDTDHVMFKAAVAIEMAEEQGNVQAMVRATEIVGRMLGAFNADRSNAAGAGAFFGGDLSKLNDDDLRGLALILAKMGSGHAAPDAGTGSPGAGGAGGEAAEG